jgi:hypothetical protein
MITWHVGLFLTMTLAQIGVQGRKQGCVGMVVFGVWAALACLVQLVKKSLSCSGTAQESRSNTRPRPA